MDAEDMNEIYSLLKDMNSPNVLNIPDINELVGAGGPRFRLLVTDEMIEEYIQLRSEVETSKTELKFHAN